MAFTSDQIEEIEAIIRDYLDENGAAMESDDDVPVVSPSELDDTYSFPLIRSVGGAPEGYGKVAMGGLVSHIADEVLEGAETDGVLMAIDEEDFDAIFNDDSD